MQPREDGFDTRLAEALKEGLVAADGSCPDAELLAAFCDGSLDATAHAACEAHIAVCVRCQEVIVAVSGEQDSQPVAVPSVSPSTVAVRPRGIPWRRVVAIAAPVGLAASVLLAVWTAREAPPSGPFDPASTERQADKVSPVAEPDTLDAVGSAQLSDAAPPSNETRPPDASPPRPPGVADSSAGRSQDARPRTEAAEQANEFRAKAEADTRAAVPAAPALEAAAPAGFVVRAPSGTVSWSVTAAGAIVRRDAGGTSGAAVLTGDQLTSGLAESETSVWIAGLGGALWHTSDGLEWKRVAAPTTEDITALADARQSGVTLIVGSGRRFTTTDGGQTWTRGPE